VNSAPEYGVRAEEPVTSRGALLRSLLWLEWRHHRLGVMVTIPILFLVMLVSAAVEPARTGMFFWLVFSLAWGTGLGIGRIEWLEGAEEFHLALPATRKQRYWVKFAVGGAVLLSVYAIGAITCLTDWFAPLWEAMNLREYDSSDLPPWVGEGPALLTLALVAPITAYAETFALSITVSRRGELGWLWRLAVVGAVVTGVIIGGERFLGESAGWLYAPLFLGYALFRAIQGAGEYEQKDIVLEVGTSEVGQRQKAVLMVLLGVAVLAGLLAWAVSAYVKGQ
jgi:hypothetical protein